MIRMFTWSARGPGFESQPGHVFSHMAFGVSMLGLLAAKGLSCRFRHGSEQILGRIQLMDQSFVTTASPLSPPFYAKSSEALAYICQTDTNVLQERMEFCRTEKILESASVYQQILIINLQHPLF